MIPRSNPTLTILSFALSIATLCPAGRGEVSVASNDAEHVKSWMGVIERLELDSHMAADGRLLIATHDGARIDEYCELADGSAHLLDETLPHPEGGGHDRTAILIEVADREDLGVVLDALAERAPYLTGWAASMKGSSGFTLESPLIAAWVDGGPFQEEWSSQNELVHRCAQLQTLERFGQLPYWLAEGIAWRVEYGLLESVYCFPNRSGFVRVEEHVEWPDQLEALFSRRKQKRDALSFEELTELQRGEYSQSAALKSYGAIQYLGDDDPDALGRWLDALVDHREHHGKVVEEDGSWHWIPGYEVPLEIQFELFANEFGERTLESMTKAFRKGVD
ncbi:MAG: hypothetical protein ACYSWX_09755 [Planctomycetota bacterium]|jgi:hypothetical protein